MFSGIIKNTGKVKSINKSNKNCTIEILSNLKLSKNEIGSSISCSGVCLTVEKFKKDYVKFFISMETMNRSNFKIIKKGNIVNLEKSLKFGDRISGHFVQGHVDTTSIVKKISHVGKSWLIDFKIKKNLKNYIVIKGSVSINGVSLTISKILKNGFQVSVIPHTLKLTNLFSLKTGDIVNIEFDVLAKYIKNFLK